MRNRIRPLHVVSVALLAVVSILLTACCGSGNSTPNATTTVTGPTATVTATPTAESPMGLTPTSVYPAVGRTNGVVIKTRRDNAYSSLTYGCAPGETVVPVGDLNGVEFNGTRIVTGETNYNSGTKAHPAYSQLTYTVSLFGNVQSFAQRAISLIISSQSGDDSGYRPDDKVVNLSSNMFATHQLELDTVDFTPVIHGDTIVNSQFCLKS